MQNLATFYAHLLRDCGNSNEPATLREPSLHEQTPRAWTERHLQCVWHDPALRPKKLLAAETNEPVEVVEPGAWNLEAGPDFLNAVLRVGSDQRVFRGDVEIHVLPQDWTSHGHHKNPLYQNVVAHVTYFPGPRPATLPACAHCVALAPPLAEIPGFSFDAIDVSLYPHANIPSTPRPCGEALKKLPATDAERLLDAAGCYRLAAKVARFRERLRHNTPARLFYEDFFGALGYKNNEASFRRLAQLYPPDTWPDAPRELHLAKLLGLGRLLPSPDETGDSASRALIRRLWDFWWANTPRDEWTPFAWDHSGRPQNAPFRRLAAAVALATARPLLHEQLAALDIASFTSRQWIRRASKIFSDYERWPEIEARLSLVQPATAPSALLGAGRVAAVLNNVFLPARLAETPLANDAIPVLPAENMSAPMRETAHRLFGPEHDTTLYASSGLRQQGLLQIWNNFCLTTRRGCETCALPAHLETR